MDGGPASADVLLQVTDALQAAGKLSRPGQPAPEGDSLEVYVDGGIRRGKDIVRALALGATAAFCGRPHQWGLSVGGQAGAERVVEIFREELTMCMQLAGCDDVTGLDRDCVMVSPKRSSLARPVDSDGSCCADQAGGYLLAALRYRRNNNVHSSATSTQHAVQ